MNDINLADAFELIAEIRGDELAVIQGSRRLRWRDVDRRTRNLAAWMKEQGAGHQAKVAIYSYNTPAYLESVAAAFRASLIPVNVNYRYREDELRYLLDNSDAEIIVVHEEFVPLLTQVLKDLRGVRAVAVIADHDDFDVSGLPGAALYERIVAEDREAPNVTRSGDDLLFLYTGGTTGMPKGVMWRQGDLFARLGGGGVAPAATNLEDHRQVVINQPAQSRLLLGPPLMHGTGWFTSLICWLTGGAVILLPNPRRFDAVEMLRTIQEDRATGVTIVGDPFAKPMVKALEAAAGQYDISSLVIMMSSGVMWSQETKQRLLAHNDKMILLDALGSSEAIGMGTSLTTAAGTVHTGKFTITDTTRLFDADLNILESKAGARGMVGVSGPQPIGYYKDPEKSARTFVEAEGRHFSIPGDWAEINEDGASLTLLGRGSVCINTGGEKVFPEEVEEVIKRFDGVRDAVVVGVPDERWGEAITAVVSTQGRDLDEKGLLEHVKAQLAGFKCPKHIVHVDEVYRSPAGKADFKQTRKTALEALGIAE
ncbi:MAG: AMP-binding protein [Deltaproteobacteria bacterium]|nr:AMP-binding protein [Deltaproteobacteria bacterium]